MGDDLWFFCWVISSRAGIKETKLNKFKSIDYISLVSYLLNKRLVSTYIYIIWYTDKNSIDILQSDIN